MLFFHAPIFLPKWYIFRRKNGIPAGHTQYICRFTRCVVSCQRKKSVERYCSSISELCHIKEWMDAKWLFLNTNKTELMVIAGKWLCIGYDSINSLQSTRNISVTFHSVLSMTTHISTTSSSLNYNLHNIGWVRKYLTETATEKLVHAVILLRLDYGNALLYDKCACIPPAFTSVSPKHSGPHHHLVTISRLVSGRELPWGSAVGHYSLPTSSPHLGEILKKLRKTPRKRGKRQMTLVRGVQRTSRNQ